MPRNDTECRVGGFKETAEYFEARAHRTRDESDKTRLSETARFYRYLAAITPDLPTHYQMPKGVSRSNRYHNRAEECRTIAALLVNPDCKRQLFDLAATYEHLAETSDEQFGGQVVIRPSEAMRRDTARLLERRDARTMPGSAAHWEPCQPNNSHTSSVLMPASATTDARAKSIRKSRSSM